MKNLILFITLIVAVMTISCHTDESLIDTINSENCGSITSISIEGMHHENPLVTVDGFWWENSHYVIDSDNSFTHTGGMYLRDFKIISQREGTNISDGIDFGAVIRVEGGPVYQLANGYDVHLDVSSDGYLTGCTDGLFVNTDNPNDSFNATITLIGKLK